MKGIVQNSNKKLLRLFLTTLYISAFTFGGGFVIVTLMKKKFVDEARWLTMEEMLDITALAQSAPGAIAVNAAILVGSRIKGAAGMAVAVLGTIIPPMAIIGGISLCYNAFASNIYIAWILMGMQAGVAAVITDVVCSMFCSVAALKQKRYLVIMAAAFIAVVLWK